MEEKERDIAGVFVDRRAPLKFEAELAPGENQCRVLLDGKECDAVLMVNCRDLRGAIFTTSGEKKCLLNMACAILDLLPGIFREAADIVVERRSRDLSGGEEDAREKRH